MHRIMTRLHYTDILKMAPLCRSLHAAVQTYPWRYQDYPGVFVHTVRPSITLRDPQLSQKWLELIRERRALRVIPDMPNGNFMFWQHHFCSMAKQARPRRALAMLPNKPEWPPRAHRLTVAHFLDQTGQSADAIEVRKELDSFNNLLGDISAGHHEHVEARLHTSVNLHAEDLPLLANRYVTSVAFGKQDMLSVLLAKPVLGMGSWRSHMCKTILEVFYRRHAPACATELRQIWLHALPPTIQDFSNVLYMGRTSAVFALFGDSCSAESLHCLSRQWLTFPTCGELEQLFDYKLLAPYWHGDLPTRQRYDQRKSLALELLGQRFLLEAAEPASSPGQSTVAVIAKNYHTEKNKDNKKYAIKCLRIMLILWRHAAGDAKIRSMMTDLLTQGGLINLSRARDMTIVDEFTAAGGRLAPCFLLQSLSDLVGGRKRKDQAQRSLWVLTTTQQDKVIATFEAVAAVSALDAFGAADEFALRTFLVGVDYDALPCRRVRRAAGDPSLR